MTVVFIDPALFLQPVHSCATLVFLLPSNHDGANEGHPEGGEIKTSRQRADKQESERKQDRETEREI